ncbi:ABC transporter substrate-binding protein [Occultella kanbiaonis]|uniref:ABC transporter substrate-binding protein n=1 Tax=Occultella kanbiaonis TaxID=2675754 RepID=UPI0013D2A7AB|nr:extracellular solute-binding protein [Occultella kanbiaonis]
MTMHTLTQATPTRRTLLVGAAGLAGAAALAACSQSGGSPSPSGTGSGTSTGSTPAAVTISVSGMPDKQTFPEANAQFLEDVAAFEELYPHITVDPRATGWQPDTFPARLAGGQLETVFQVPVTEAPTLIRHGQVVPITDFLADLEGSDLLNERVLEPVSVDGELYGIPVRSHSLGLIYNRSLFEAAGLDPDAPPTTWDEVREAARAIAALGDGVAGFAVGTKNGTEGGGMYAAINASFGDDTFVVEEDGSTTITFDSEAGRRAMSFLHDVRWQDDAWPGQTILGIDDVKQLIATERLGLWVHAPDQVRSLTLKFGVDPSTIGLAAMPQAGGDATQLGGSMALFNPAASPEQLTAASQWIWFEYLRKYLDPEVAAAEAEALRGDPANLVGIPELPIFTGDLYERYNEAIAPFVNAPLENYADYIERIDELRLVPEPNAQIKSVLNRMVQQAVTEQDVDVEAMLADGAGEAEQAASR